MQNNNFVYWVLIGGCLITGFIAGWLIKEVFSGNEGTIKSNIAVVKIHDTIKTPVVGYKVNSGTEYNIDSIIQTVNQFWKDSLKSLYGRGLFEARFTKNKGEEKREFTLESRIPIDPEAELNIQEEQTPPASQSEAPPFQRGNKNFGICGGIEFGFGKTILGSVGLKYYFLDFKYLSLAGTASGNYNLSSKGWEPNARIEAEVRF